MKKQTELQKLRIYRDFTQKEFAIILKITHTKYREYEINKIYPDYTTRKKICNMLNCNESLLFNIIDKEVI